MLDPIVSSDFVLRKSAAAILWQAGDIIDPSTGKPCLNSDGQAETYLDRYGKQELHPDTALKILHDFYGFLWQLGHDNITEYLQYQDMESLIQDYWVARQDHRDGFLDRWLPDELMGQIEVYAYNAGKYEVDVFSDDTGWSY